VTDRPQYDTFSDLVAGIGKDAMESIRLNAAAYTISTVSGSRDAFSERSMVLIRDVGYAEIIRLMAADGSTAKLRLPNFTLTTIEDAVLFTVATHVYKVHYPFLADHCFRWAEGDFLKTLERCADVAEKVVSVRQSRDMRKIAESIRRTLARFEHEGGIPDDFDPTEMVVQKIEIFRPVKNDQTLDWTRLNAVGIDRPVLFELTERMKNYLNLSGIDRNRFNTLVSDEIAARWPKPVAATQG
jgi:hypothetical protein